MDTNNSSLGIKKRIFFLNRISAAMEPLVIRLVEWGYDSVSCHGDLEKNIEGISKEKEIGLIDLTGDFEIEKLLRGVEVLKSKVPQLSILGVFSGKMKFSWNQVYKLGIVGVFQFPLEEELFFNRIFEICPQNLDIKKVGLDGLVKVDISSLDRLEALPFDVFVYLAVNQKVVLFRKGNTPIEEQTRNKFKDNQKWSLYIRRSDLSVYQKDLGQNLFDSNRQATEVKEQLQKTMHSFFSESEYTTESADQLLSNLRAAIDKQMEFNEKTKMDWKTANRLITEKLTHLSHSQNVSIYCALFGKALDFDNIDELTIAGLLHDLGLGDLPPEIVWKSEKMMTLEEKAQYQLHPGFAKHTLSKKMKLSNVTIDSILYHHERMDGSGYPYSLKDSEIPFHAKILAFADEFDKETSLRPGFVQLTPREAMVKLAGLEGNPVSSVFDPILFEPLLKLFYEVPILKLQNKGVNKNEGETLKFWIKEHSKMKTPVTFTEDDSINQFRIQLKEHFKTLKNK